MLSELQALTAAFVAQATMQWLGPHPALLARQGHGSMALGHLPATARPASQVTTPLQARPSVLSAQLASMLPQQEPAKAIALFALRD